MAMFNTLLLDQTTWDLVIDAYGNIAVAEPPYALAQDVACACKLFKGELIYDVGAGIPYFEDILGHGPPPELVASYLEDAAKTVPGVVSAHAELAFNSTRVVSGTLSFTSELGVVDSVEF